MIFLWDVIIRISFKVPFPLLYDFRGLTKLDEILLQKAI